MHTHRPCVPCNISYDCCGCHTATAVSVVRCGNQAGGCEWVWCEAFLLLFEKRGVCRVCVPQGLKSTRTYVCVIQQLVAQSQTGVRGAPTILLFFEKKDNLLLFRYRHRGACPYILMFLQQQQAVDRQFVFGQEGQDSTWRRARTWMVRVYRTLVGPHYCDLTWQQGFWLLPLYRITGCSAFVSIIDTCMPGKFKTCVYRFSCILIDRPASSWDHTHQRTHNEEGEQQKMETKLDPTSFHSTTEIKHHACWFTNKWKNHFLNSGGARSNKSLGRALHISPILKTQQTTTNDNKFNKHRHTHKQTNAHQKSTTACPTNFPVHQQSQQQYMLCPIHTHTSGASTCFPQKAGEFNNAPATLQVTTKHNKHISVCIHEESKNAPHGDCSLLCVVYMFHVQLLRASYLWGLSTGFNWRSRRPDTDTSCNTNRGPDQNSTSGILSKRLNRQWGSTKTTNSK